MFGVFDLNQYHSAIKPDYAIQRNLSGGSVGSKSISSGNAPGRINTRNATVNGKINSNGAHNTNLNIKNNSNAVRNTNLNTKVNSKAVNNANLKATANSKAVHNALNSRSFTRALNNKSALQNPHNRALLTASAATAAWKHEHDHNGHDDHHDWWRHHNGGYGWVGPLFWPFAYHDTYDCAWWGYGYCDSFWNYGYDDIYVGLFAPYNYDDLTGYLPQYERGNNVSGSRSGTRKVSAASATRNAATGPLAQMCGEDSRDIAGLQIDQFQRAIQPDDAQRAALDELANASVKAGQDIKAVCPTDIALTAPMRLAIMQKRIAAIVGAVATVQPPLEKFYGLLSDEQKARLTALGKDQHQNQTAATTAGSPAQSCSATQPGVTDWPTAEIDRKVHPTEAQRASLVVLQNATAKAADMLKASCPADNALTPPARLAAVGKRLETMLNAVNTVLAPLNDFYGALNDEQKAQFDAIGVSRELIPLSAR